jgi:hypothetical protein
MGWIANLKKTPAFGAVEDISVTGGETKTVVNGSAPTIRVTNGTGENKVQFGPLPASAVGSMKTAVLIASSGGGVTVGPYPAGADATNMKNAMLRNVGEAGQWVWDGSKWNSIESMSSGIFDTSTDF